MRSSLIDHDAMHKLHQHCFACSSNNPWGLMLDFYLDEQSGIVTGHFFVAAHHQGYNGLLHGGLASTLLDAAMTHCLLCKHIPALTAELSVRYHAPIKLGAQIKIRAELVKQKRHIYLMVATLEVDHEVTVSASAKFMRASEPLLSNI